MRRIRQGIDRLSVKKKLVLYGYLTITPVLVVICIVLTVYNYRKVVAERLNNDLFAVRSLAESWGALQTDIKDFSTYICINEEIHRLLTTDYPEIKNANARLWMDEAPMGIVQDMIALKGEIRTLAIYAENGIRPYLSGMDGSVNLPDAAAVKQTQIYEEALESENGMVWKYVPKGRGETYEVNRSDKLVLYREIFDLAQKKTLGHIVIGASSEYFESLARSAAKEGEAVLILDKNGGVLSCVGEIDGRLYEYLQSEEFVGGDYRERAQHFTFGKCEVVCAQLEKNGAVFCKVVPEYSLQMQLRDAAYMPLVELLGVLIGMLPLLLIIVCIMGLKPSPLGETFR